MLKQLLLICLFSIFKHQSHALTYYALPSNPYCTKTSGPTCTLCGLTPSDSYYNYQGMCIAASAPKDVSVTGDNVIKS